MLNLRLRLRTKIVLWFLLLVGLQGLIFSVVINHYFFVELKEMARSRALHLSESILTRCRDQLLTGDVVKLHRLLHEEQRNTPGIRYAFVLDHEGDLVAHTFPKDLPTVLLSVHPSGALSQSRLVMVSNELLYDVQNVKAWGTLRLGVSLVEVEKTVLQIRSYVLLATFVSLLSVVALALMISRPVERLAAFAAQPDDADAPVADPTVSTMFETSQLLKGFGDVTRQLRSRIEELADGETNVRHQKEYLENLNDNLGLGVVVLNADKSVEFVNKHARHQLGVVSGGDSRSLFTSGSFEGGDCHFFDLVRKRQPFQGILQAPNGNAYAIKAIPIENRDGSESMLLRIYDVSEGMVPG